MIRTLGVATALLLGACGSSPRVREGVARGAAAEEAWRRGDLRAGDAGYAEALRDDRMALDEAAVVRHLNNRAVLAHLDGRDAAPLIDDARSRTGGSSAERDRARLEMQRAAVSLGRGDLDAAALILGDERLAAWTAGAEPADRVQFWSLRAALELRRHTPDTVAAAHAAARARAAADTPEASAVAALITGRVLEERRDDGGRAAARVAYRQALEDAGTARHPWLQLASLRALRRVADPAAGGDEVRRLDLLIDDLATALRQGR